MQNLESYEDSLVFDQFYLFFSVDHVKNYGPRLKKWLSFCWNWKICGTWKSFFFLFAKFFHITRQIYLSFSHFFLPRETGIICSKWQDNNCGFKIFRCELKTVSRKNEDTCFLEFVSLKLERRKRRKTAKSRKLWRFFGFWCFMNSLIFVYYVL